MIKLVPDLLNVSRIEEGKFVFKFAEFDISKTMKSCCRATLWIKWE